MCGIVGLITTNHSRQDAPLAVDAFKALTALQHRGQDASGIVSYDIETSSFHQHKNQGLANDVFGKGEVFRLNGPIAIGHNRYATVGSNNYEDIQPIISGFPVGISVAHNGNLVNYHALKNQLKSKYNIQALTNNDVECFLNLMNLYISKNALTSQDKFSEVGPKQLLMAVKEILIQAQGAYSLVGILANKGLFGLRDPYGIRPLVIGKRDDENGISYCLCSETAGLEFTGHTYMRDVLPGEFVFISLEGELLCEQVLNLGTAHCMFEWVYFAGAESSLENLSVYKARLRLGEALADQVLPLIENGTISPDFVSPVPDTSRTAALSLGEKLKLPYRESLLKNRYVQRSFILKSQKERDQAIKRKLIPIRSEIEGKNILLVDDSVVRGTTSKQIVSLLREVGAKEIVMAITCPPIKHVCFYGIDFPNENELIAHGRNEEEVAKAIGADRVIFLEIGSLRKSFDSLGLCTGCLNNEYPTSVMDALDFTSIRQKEKEVNDERAGNFWE